MDTTHMFNSIVSTCPRLPLRSKSCTTRYHTPCLNTVHKLFSSSLLKSLTYFTNTYSMYVVNNPNTRVSTMWTSKVTNLGSHFSCASLHFFSFFPQTEYIDKRRKDVVFQFGGLILELVTGQSLGNEDELVQWVQESGFACSMHKMVDADLGDNYDSKELKSLLMIARLCTRDVDEPIISIPQLLRYLQGKVDPPVPSF